MNKENIDKQLELYYKGLTSSKEEIELLKQLDNSKKETNIWFNYIRHDKKVAPKNLESTIWASIQKRENRKRRILLRIGSVAASIILAVSVFLTVETWPQKEMSYAEKAAVLEEALAMISETQETAILGEILYEDEILIIYTK